VKTNTTRNREPLTRDRVIEAALRVMDEEGLDAVSMRRVAREVGVEAMSLYHHVRGKDDILDGVTDLLVGEIDLRRRGSDWKRALRQQILAARAVLLRHPWAARVIQTRTQLSPATLRYMDAVLGILRTGGFSIDLAHHAMHILGSRVLGFTQDLFVGSKAADAPPLEVSAMLALELKDKYPHLTELAMTVSHQGGVGGCDDNVEFELAIDLILNGLERLGQKRHRR
jgi:AcrR family transcriptional regulator